MRAVVARVGPGLGRTALAAAAGSPGRALGASAGPPEHLFDADLYDVLGVGRTATREELKRSFRSRARVLHPDACPESGGKPDKAAFVRLLHAYQVLANPRTRQLYDLSREAGGPRVLRAAAASGVPGAAAAAYEEVEVDLSWGLSDLFKGQKGGAGALDRARQELQGELHSAVRRAYLGPRLDDLPAASLPDAFEADERAAPDCPDLLQLVSGRQLLGAVRERRLERLAHEAAAAALGTGPQAAAALPTAAGQQGGSAAAVERPQGGSPACQHAAAGADQVHAEQQRQGQQGQQGQQQQQQQQRQREPDILDLIVGEAPLASAVRHFPRQQRQAEPGGTPSDSSGGGGAEAEGSAPPAEVIHIFDRGGELLAQVEAQQLDPGSATASSARVLNARRVHTHTVYRTQTPLVRHLTFSAEPAGTGLQMPVRPSRLVVCRARRAWLPPSSLWVFKPLSYEHDIGGWCLEWAGEAQQDHPAWLHPAVYVLTAAFDSLDSERAARQPLGLFARVRAARAAAAEGGDAEGGVHGGGWRAWLRSALRFHGRH